MARNNGRHTFRTLVTVTLLVVLGAMALCASGCTTGAIEADAQVDRLTEQLSKLEKDFNEHVEDAMAEWALQDKKDEANARAWAAADRWIHRKLQEEEEEE